MLSKAQILDRVWNYDFGGQANVVELYISYLRKKIDAGPGADDPHRARRRATCSSPAGLIAHAPTVTAPRTDACWPQLLARAGLSRGHASSSGWLSVLALKRS